MSDSDLPDAGRPGKWPRPLLGRDGLALDSIVTVLMNAHMMAPSRARSAGTCAACSREPVPTLQRDRPCPRGTRRGPLEAPVD